MTYNFERCPARYHVGSGKWNEMAAFGVSPREDVIPFSVADMEFEVAPEIREGLKEYIDHYVLGYANPTDEYKQAVCKWQKERHSWEIEPEWILSTPGVVNAFHNAVQTFTQSGEGVIMLTPTYYPMYNAVKANGRVLVGSDLVLKGDRYEIDFADFEAKAKDPNVKMFLFCNPQNPTSRVFTREEVEHLGRICLDNGIFVCSDEIHYDLVMPGHTHTVFASISDEFADHSAVCTAASKTFNLAGMQTSSVIIKNEEARARFYANQKKLEINPKCSILGYEATRLAYEKCGGWHDQCLDVIYRNYRTCVDFFAKELPQVRPIQMEGTYLLWMDCRAVGLGYEALARVLKEARLFFDDGYIFGAPGEGFERWNLACPTRYVEEGLQRMKAALLPYCK